MARPVLVVNPHADEAFTALAKRLVGNGADTPTALELELRETHPRARVYERSLSAESVVTWYVYREGTWIPRP